jgi:hypothetical protein
VFYPQKLAQGKELEYAASRLTTRSKSTAPITKFVLLLGATWLTLESPFICSGFFAAVIFAMKRASKL